MNEKLSIEHPGEGWRAQRDWFCDPPCYLVQSDDSSHWHKTGAQALNDSSHGLDVQWLADVVCYQVPLTSRTCRPNVRALRPGAMVSSMERGTSLDVVYPEPIRHQHDPSPSMVVVEEALRADLSQLDPQTTVFHLSAGLDSSLLVLLACQIHGANNIRAITLRGSVAAERDEVDLAARLSSDLGVQLDILNVADIDPWAAAERMIDILRMPAGHPSALARYLLDNAAVAQGATTIVTGRGADEVFAGYDWHLPEMTAGEHHARVQATQPERVKRLFPGWLAESQVAYGAFFANAHSLERRLQYDIATLGADWQFIEHQLSLGLGYTAVSPFANPRVMRAAYALPAETKIAGGFQKVAMREHFRELYPEYLLAQPKRGLTLDIAGAINVCSTEAILDKLGHDWLESFGRELDLRVLQQMITESRSGRSQFGWQIWNLYLASRIQNSFVDTNGLQA